MCGKPKLYNFCGAAIFLLLSVSNAQRDTAVKSNGLYVAPVALFAENRQRLCRELRQNGFSDGVVFLAGGVQHNRYNTDSTDSPFRQESYFYWTFGVIESEFNGAVRVRDCQAVLFAPVLDPSYAVWSGKIEPESYFTEKYAVNSTLFVENNTTVAQWLANSNSSPVLLLRAENTDSGNTLQPPKISGIERLAVNNDTLYRIMAELRVLKTDHELEAMRYSGRISSDSHRQVMLSAKPGMYEYQMESGPNGAVLHYGHAGAPNSRKINDGDMCLFDMGHECAAYGSDLTISFPINGKFTERQKVVYNAVLDANEQVFKNAKPGVRWTDMHLLAEKVILTHLLAANVLVGDVDEMMDVRLGAVFMPHGLGHFIGLDVHDVGGYLADATPRSPLPGLSSLRTTRILKERMVISDEPGIYLIDTLLDAALNNASQSKFLNKDAINSFRGFGGVRIEDIIVIWEKGNERLSNLPRTVDEIENFMAQGMKDQASNAKISLIGALLSAVFLMLLR